MTRRERTERSSDRIASRGIVLLGAPGSGKGTLASGLSKRFRIPHISTGDLFRQQIRGRTPLGVEVESYVQKGELIPDALVLAMVENRLTQEDCRSGFLLDGFPRTVAQAVELDRLLAGSDRRIDAVLSLQVRDATLVERLSNRRVCESCGRTSLATRSDAPTRETCGFCHGRWVQRPDDKPEIIRIRLARHHERSEPVADHYARQGLLVELENEGTIGSMLSEAYRLLKEEPHVPSDHGRSRTVS